MRYLILTVALLIGVLPETVQAQIGGRATHGSHGGTRNFQISMPQLRLLIREVVREVVRETHTSRAGATSRSTEKTIDQLTSAVERRLALRAPLRLVRNSTESGGLRGREGGDHTQSASGGERKPWERNEFLSRNSESKRRQTEENRRKHTERTKQSALLNRPPVQTTLFPRPIGGGGNSGGGGGRPPRPNPGGGGQVGIGGGPGPVPPTFPTNPGMPAPG